MRTSLRKSALLLALLALLLTACRASTTETTVPEAEPAVSTTTTAPRPTTTTTGAPPPEFPVQVPTDSGNVRIPAEPQRIVSLSATHTEMLYAIGAGTRVVATDITSNFPAAALETAKLDSFNFNIEEVAALDPDLVIIAFDFQGEGEALETLGIPFLLLGPPSTFLDALTQIEDVGLAVGRGEAAFLLARQMAAEAIDLIDASAPIGGITFFHEVDETLYSATSESFVGDLYRMLGLSNIADSAGVAGQFPQLSAEYIVDQDPDFVFLADANFGVTTESVAARPGWDTMSAVVEGNVVALNGDLAGRWGPRTVDLMRSILEVVEASVP